MSHTYKIQIEILDKSLMNFERTYSGIKPVYNVIQAISPQVKVLAYAHHRENSALNSVLAALSPNGGYVMNEYACFSALEGPFMQGLRGRYVNPFEFFRRAFAYDNVPIPDTTTLAGKRIYYSHTDGDGWNNLTELEKYREKKMSCAEAMFHEIYSTYKDLPVTVGPIGADIDLNWVAKNRSREAAQAIFSLPHVEVGCHTFTHPFDWLFFKHYNPQKEIPYLTLYPNGSWEYNGLTGSYFHISKFAHKNTLGGDVSAVYQITEETSELKPGALSVGYAVPRAYALQPFNADMEVIGSIDEVNHLLENRRKVKIIQWSGNCLVFERIVKLSREAGVRNINGGDTRFDNETLSYAWVKSIGRQVRNQQQIYSSGSNENVYTSGWTGRFWGQILAQETFKNTESPIRVKPINLYYHIFSAEKLSSLSALIQNLEYIKKQNIIPTETSHFAAIADGFYTTQIKKMGSNQWELSNRDALQTLRFDHSSFKGVDFAKSQGVIGPRRFQGSLYVYLDSSFSKPIIALQELEFNHEEPLEQIPYLIESRWEVWKLERNNDKIKMKTRGYGLGEMKWRVPQDGRYKIQIVTLGKNPKIFEEKEVMAKNGYLEITTQTQSIRPIEISIIKL